MSQLLIMLVDETHPDYRISSTLKKRFDVIAVKPTGEAWGAYEDQRVWNQRKSQPWHAKTAIVDITDMPYAIAKQLDESAYRPSTIADAEHNPEDPADCKVLVFARQWGVVEAAVPAAVLTALTTIGYYATTKAKVSGLIVNKVNGAIFSA